MFSDWLNIQCRGTITVFEPDKTDFQTFRNYVFNTCAFVGSEIHDTTQRIDPLPDTVSNSFAFVASSLRLPINDLPLQSMGTVSNRSVFVSSTLRLVVIPLTPSPIVQGPVRNVSSFIFSTLQVVVVSLPTVQLGTVRTTSAFTASTLS